MPDRIGVVGPAEPEIVYITKSKRDAFREFHDQAITLFICLLEAKNKETLSKLMGQVIRLKVFSEMNNLSEGRF